MALTRYVHAFEIHYVIASVVSSLVAMSFSFAANRFLTFKKMAGSVVTQYPRYLLVYGASVLWQNALLVAMVEGLGAVDWMAKIVAIVVVGYGWNFLLAKFWVFRYTA